MRPLDLGMSCWSSFKVTNNLHESADESAGHFSSFKPLCDYSISACLCIMAILLIFSPPGLVFCHFSPIFSFSLFFPVCSLPLCHLLFHHSLVFFTYLFLTLAFYCVSSVFPLLFLFSVYMKPSVRFHSCVFLCAFLTSLSLDSVLKIFHVTLCLCCPKAVAGFSTAPLSSFSVRRCRSYRK